MSAFVLNQNEINILTQATDAMLKLNKRYPASYPLAATTVDLIGKYADDLHNIYRALFIANIKAVNGRYGENERTLPKYSRLIPWDTERLNVQQMKKDAGAFGCYMYQCSEDPIYGSPVYNAFCDIYKLLCLMIVNKSVGWDGEDR